MARPVVTRDQVFAAANALVEAGIKPTTILIREKVGGGSYGTIQKLLAEWELEHTIQAQLPPLPDALQQRGQELLRSIWAEALQQDDARVAQVRAEAQHQIEEIKAQLRGVEQINAHLEGDADTLNHRIDELHTAAEDLRNQLGAAQAAAQVAEARATTLDELVASLRAELAEARQTRVAQVDDAIAAIQGQLAQQSALIEQLAARQVNGQEP